jgi:MFS family permease
MTGRRLLFVMCGAHVLSLAGIGTFPSLLPTFFDVWRISNTEAGWISGIYYGGYAAAVPILASLTDRMDSRRVYLWSAALCGVSTAAFAVLADGFWTALIFRALAGIGVAGTYMPGLKMLTDRVSGGNQSRMVAFYTASFGIGSSVSIWMAGAVEEWAGWRWACALAALGSLGAIAIVAALVRPIPAVNRESQSRLLDFRPVFRNRAAMAYVLAYGAHCWELLGFRSWMVAFLAFSATLQPPGAWIWSATIVAGFVNFLGVPASILGNEAAMRFGRRRAATMVMLGATVLACVIGFTAPLPYALVVLLFAVYGIFVTADSGTITAGTVIFARPEHKGATMAVHSFLGFLTSFLGPLAFGVVLDAAGGNASTLAWGLAFAAMGAGVALGPLALARLGRADEAAAAAR